MKKKRNEIAFNKSKNELNNLSKLNENEYIDLYYGDASHFNLVPNIPYAWQAPNEAILLPSFRGKSTSVFGLMNTSGKLFYDFFDTTINAESLIAFFDKFVENIVKKTIVVLDNSSLHTCKKFKAKIQEWEQLDLIIYFIPPYSPELNKIEILWRFVKYDCLPFDSYTCFDNLKSNIKEVLDGFGTKCIINFN